MSPRRPESWSAARAPPPLPGQGPATHPFATATAYVAEWEGQLGEMLRTAPDLDAFLAVASSRGYTVEAVERAS
jgi:hypothetical protein